MNGKFHAALAVTLACFSLGLAIPAPGQAQATAASTSKAPRLLPVFVEVDKQGHLAKVEPATSLQPNLQKLLEKTLAKMITKPAHNAKGQPVASQFIITLAMQTRHLADGSFRAGFSYHSVKTVPAGDWHWVHSGHQYGLARKGMGFHDILNHSASCVADMGIGAGHRKTYIINGKYMGTEPYKSLAGSCFVSQH